MTDSVQKKGTVLCVVNKRLPKGDYRLAYAKHTSLFHVKFALPERPAGLTPDDFVQIRFGEGMRISYLNEFRRLHSYLHSRHHDVDLVHFYSTNLVLWGPIVASLAGIPSISTLTGFGRIFTSPRKKVRLLQSIYWFLLSLSLRFSRRLLLQNQADLELLRRRFGRKRGILLYVGSAVDLDPVTTKHFGSEPLVVILVARLMDDKGIDDFLTVAKAFVGEPVDFQLIGPPSTGFECLLERVKEAEQMGHIKYHGELDSESTLSRLAEAHILFFPSYGEGLSRVMLEAGFCKLYPIAYDIPSNLDLVRPGGGALLKRGDTMGAVNQIRELLTNRALLSSGAQAFQHHVCQRFGIDSFTQRMDGIYSDIFEHLLPRKP